VYAAVVLIVLKAPMCSHASFIATSCGEVERSQPAGGVRWQARKENACPVPPRCQGPLTRDR
jgi:hypothetical protein